MGDASAAAAAGEPRRYPLRSARCTQSLGQPSKPQKAPRSVQKPAPPAMRPQEQPPACGARAASTGKAASLPKAHGVEASAGQGTGRGANTSRGSNGDGGGKSSSSEEIRSSRSSGGESSSSEESSTSEESNSSEESSSSSSSEDSSTNEDSKGEGVGIEGLARAGAAQQATAFAGASGDGSEGGAASDREAHYADREGSENESEGAVRGRARLPPTKRQRIGGKGAKTWMVPSADGSGVSVLIGVAPYYRPKPRPKKKPGQGPSEKKQQEKEKEVEERTPTWAASVRLPFSLGGGWMVLGKEFVSLEGAVLAADRGTIALWGREVAARRGMLNAPLESFGPEERQRYGVDLGDFLASLEPLLRSYMPAPSEPPSSNAHHVGPSLHEEQQHGQAEPMQIDGEAEPTQGGPMPDGPMQQGNGAEAVLGKPHAAAAGTAAGGRGADRGHNSNSYKYKRGLEFVSVPRGEKGEGETAPYLDFDPARTCGRCPSCRQPWRGEACHITSAGRRLGSRPSWERYGGTNPVGAAEAQRVQELQQQRKVIRQVLKGTKLQGNQISKAYKAATVAAAAAGVPLAQAAAAAAERHGIDIEGSDGEGAGGSSFRVQTVRGWFPGTFSRTAKSGDTKRGAAVAVAAAVAAAEATPQLPPPSLPAPALPRRVVWVEQPPKLSHRERLGLHTTVRRRAREAKAGEELQAALEEEMRATGAMAGAGTGANAGVQEAAGDGDVQPLEGTGVGHAGAAVAWAWGGGGGRFGRGGGAVPAMALGGGVWVQPHLQLLQELVEERHRGGMLFEVQRSQVGGLPLCPQCGTLHRGFFQRSSVLAPQNCPVWQAANTVTVPDHPKECPSCADREVPGCGHCLPQGHRLVVASGANPYGTVYWVGTKRLIPAVVRAPWLAMLAPHTLDTMQALQGVADAADADLGQPQASGRFGPKALLACVLLGEAAVEAQLRQAAGEGPPWRLQAHGEGGPGGRARAQQQE